MATALPVRPHAHDEYYTRRLIYVGHKSLVESRCSRCGMLVIGTLTEGLIEGENAHLRECAQRRFRPSPVR